MAWPRVVIALVVMALLLFFSHWSVRRKPLELEERSGSSYWNLGVCIVVLASSFFWVANYDFMFIRERLVAFFILF